MNELRSFADELAAGMGTPRAPRLPPLIKPGAYPGVSMPEYLALPTLSASVLCALINECPRAAWHSSWLNAAQEHDFNDASDAGEIAHSILLEGSMGNVAIIDPADHPAKSNGNIPTGWGNKSIREARDAARDAGKIPMLPCDVAAVNAMVDSAHAFIASLRETEPAVWAAFQPHGGHSELSCVWDDFGTLCRMRPDRISSDRTIIIDPKFTKRSAEPDSWARSMMTSMGYRMRAAFYRRGAKRLFNTEPDYLFLVIEQDPPHLCSLVGLDPANIALGTEQVESALRDWNKCVERNIWPAYPSRVCYPELTPWELARWEERQGIPQDGIPYSLDQVFTKNVDIEQRYAKREVA